MNDKEYILIRCNQGGWEASNPAGHWSVFKRTIGLTMEAAQEYAIKVLGWEKTRLVQVSQVEYRLERVIP